MVKSAVLGFPRIGPNRELKKVEMEEEKVKTEEEKLIKELEQEKEPNKGDHKKV